MIIGIAKEIKNQEYRVAAVPSAVLEMTRRGHKVYVEKDAGTRAGFPDEEYVAAGAEICDTATIYEKSELVYKVKEVLPQEFGFYHENQILFTYLHSETRPEMTADLLGSKVIGIAYENVRTEDGKLPLLQPMSEIAGKGGFISAFNYMQTLNGGCGKLLSRVCGLEAPHVVIIGCGSVGMAAAEYAAALGNKVTMLDVYRKALENAHCSLPTNVETMVCNRANILSLLPKADVVINCVMWDHRRNDHLVYREDLKLMKPTAVIVDVSSDDHGAIETSVMTTHDDPVYREEGILHYAVPNIPSMYANTASQLLCAATLPYLLQIADQGVEKALKNNKALCSGVSFWKGEVVWKETADMMNYPYLSPDKLAERL